jgi:hypothetical protein
MLAGTLDIWIDAFLVSLSPSVMKRVLPLHGAATRHTKAGGSHGTRTKVSLSVLTTVTEHFCLSPRDSV